MIQPLRRVHWRWMVVLALILPLLLAAALLQRPPETEGSALPEVIGRATLETP